MTLEDFLLLHDGGCCQNCVSIHQMPYDRENHGYTKTYFEENSQGDIVASGIFGQIADKKVERFNIIGGGMYPIELCIYLEREDNGCNVRS